MNITEERVVEEEVGPRLRIDPKETGEKA